MLELLETIDTDAQVVRRCRALKERGYALALDDVCRYDKNFEPLHMSARAACHMLVVISLHKKSSVLDGMEPLDE